MRAGVPGMGSLNGNDAFLGNGMGVYDNGQNGFLHNMGSVQPNGMGGAGGMGNIMGGGFGGAGFAGGGFPGGGIPGGGFVSGAFDVGGMGISSGMGGVYGMQGNGFGLDQQAQSQAQSFQQQQSFFDAPQSQAFAPSQQQVQQGGGRGGRGGRGGLRGGHRGKALHGNGGMAPEPTLESHAAPPPAPAVKANPNARTSSTTLSQMTAARFADLNINALTKKAIAEVLRYETMTLVQQQSLPVALTGADVLAKAKTGTGKTLSFLLPAVEAALRPPSGGPKIKILIVSPTRELASQIYEEGQMVCKFHSGFKLMCIYGGTNMNKDINGFKAPPDLLVATPGRLNDHLQNSGLDRMMLGLRVLILDEADQLLDMGFRPAILDMLSRLPPKESRQTLLFSATMPNDVQSIAKIGMRANYSFVDTVCRSPLSCLSSPACSRYPPTHPPSGHLPPSAPSLPKLYIPACMLGGVAATLRATRRARTAAEVVWCRWERRRTRTSTCRSTTSSPPSSRRPRSSWAWSRKPRRSLITR